MRREGASPDAIARAVYPESDELGHQEKHALEQPLSSSCRAPQAAQRSDSDRVRHGLSVPVQ